MSLGCMIAQPTQPVPASHRKPRPSISRSPPPTPGTPDPTARPPSNPQTQVLHPPNKSPSTSHYTNTNRPPPPSPPQPSPSSCAFPPKNPNLNTKPRITTRIKQPSSKNAPPSITPAVSNQERDGGVKGNEYIARWSPEPGARERGRGGKRLEGWKMPLDIFVFSRGYFSKLRNDCIVSDRDNTQLQLETIPPPQPKVTRGKDNTPTGFSNWN